jgi:hypothetical protein
LLWTDWPDSKKTDPGDWAQTGQVWRPRAGVAERLTLQLLFFLLGWPDFLSELGDHHF